MRAIAYRKYGLPDVLELRQIEKPTPKDNEILLKVHAVSLNASDWEFLTATPAYIRTIGFFKPKYSILGSDVAGLVETVGKGVEAFKPGDAVFGDTLMHGMGGFAEYVCVPEDALVSKPASLSFEEASTLPQSGGVALQGLRDKGEIQPGYKVLINGAGGGSGTFSIQIAKVFGAEVTGVDGTEKLDVMRSVGADHVVDYTQEDFTKIGQRYDLILDLVAHRSIFDLKRALSSGGIYVLVGGSVPRILQTVLLGPLISKMGSKKMGMLLHRQNTKDLKFILELIRSKKVVPVIDRTYALHDVPEALRYLGEGHAKGKVVITL